ncbi:MAG: hypothetical protein Q7L19_01960 [Pseudohongiella sp.]|nr:hypothetical protein [Pseudohongiella sp.]
MLLPDNIHPENSVYYNGAILLKILQNEGNMEMFELYEKAKVVRAMTFPLFVLCLDWLYLVDAAVLNSGEVELCS